MSHKVINGCFVKSTISERFSGITWRGASTSAQAQGDLGREFLEHIGINAFSNTSIQRQKISTLNVGSFFVKSIVSGIDPIDLTANHSEFSLKDYFLSIFDQNGIFNVTTNTAILNGVTISMNPGQVVSGTFGHLLFSDLASFEEYIETKETAPVGTGQELIPLCSEDIVVKLNDVELSGVSAANISAQISLNPISNRSKILKYFPSMPIFVDLTIDTYTKEVEPLLAFFNPGADAKNIQLGPFILERCIFRDSSENVVAGGYKTYSWHFRAKNFKYLGAS